MSEEDYINRFLDLARYSVYLQNTKDEIWKAQRLIEGARLELKERLVVVHVTSFEDVCSKMYTIAQRIQETKEEREGSMFKASSHMRLTGGISKKSFVSCGSGGSSSGSGSWKRRGSLVRDRPNISTYNRVGPKRDEGAVVQTSVTSAPAMCSNCRTRHRSDHLCLVCHNCGKLGHMSRHCTLPRQGGSTGGLTLPSGEAAPSMTKGSFKDSLAW